MFGSRSSKHKLLVAAAGACLIAGQVQADDVTLTWIPPTTAGTAPNAVTFTEDQIAQIKYNVYYGTETGKYGPAIPVPTAGTTSFKITGLKSGTKYFFSADANLVPYGTSNKAIEINYVIPYPQINVPSTLKITFVPVSTPLSMYMTPTTIGQTSAGLVPITKNVVAFNTSPAEIKVNTIFIVPPTAPFKLNTAFPFTIAASGKKGISVTFSPPKPGYYYANAVLDTDAGYLVEPLSGVGANKMKLYITSTSAAVKGVKISLAGRRIFVISDIHGCYGKFKKLLNLIEFTDKDRLIVNGDIVDRGPNIRGLVDHLMGMKNATVLLGNHEEMMLQCIYAKHNSKDLENQWKHKGGKETMESFGLKSIKDLPLKYKNWFKTRHLYVKVGDYVISHAGVNLRHDKPFRDTQGNRDYILWNREVKAPKGQTIVVGHTPKSIKIIIKSLKTNKIYIDGGCVYGGRLVALNLNDRTISTV